MMRPTLTQLVSSRREAIVPGHDEVGTADELAAEAAHAGGPLHGLRRVMYPGIALAGPKGRERSAMGRDWTAATSRRGSIS